MDKETNQNFTSPVRRYIAQLLQASFPFGQEYEEKVETFEIPSAKYEVRVMECYLTKKEAGEKNEFLDLSKTLKLGSDLLFFSSSWFEVHERDHYEAGCTVENECVYEGDGDEIVNFLLELDDEHEHFSYCGRGWFCEPEIDDDPAYKSRPLNLNEQNSLDALIKQRLDALYRR